MFFEPSFETYKVYIIRLEVWLWQKSKVDMLYIMLYVFSVMRVNFLFVMQVALR